MTTKNKNISILAIIFCSLLYFEGYSQFPDPAGDNGSLTKAFKTIYEGNHACWPWATAHKSKTVYSRRLQFRAHFYYNCWYDEEELPYTGWNKLGKIAYEFTTNDEDKFKMHVGWRMKKDGTSPYLWLSLYYHEDYHYVSNLLDKIYFPYDATVWVDMYMNASTIGLIIGDKCIGIREYGNPSNGNTFTKLRKTFYFGGKSEAPHKMELQFDNMWYDEPGFAEVFNSRNYMTWNQSYFSKFDDYTFTANLQIDGSGKDEWVDTNDPLLVENECHIGYANITFIAGERILLHPGFKAHSGSHFIAKINSKLLDNVIADSTDNILQTDLCNKLPDSSYAIEDVNYYKIDDNDYMVNQKSFNIYPNPNPGLFNIELSEEGLTGYSVEIINTMGKTVYKKQNIPTGKTEINISSQTKGVYFVKVHAGDKLFTEKVIYR